jgi:GAF domain
VKILFGHVDSFAQQGRLLVRELALVGYQQFGFGVRAPLIIEDVRSDQLLRPLERDYLLSLGTKTCILVPLMFGEQLVGAFGLRFLRLRRFGAQELELAQALADQATPVLQLSRLADAAKEAAVAREREKAGCSRSRSIWASDANWGAADICSGRARTVRSRCTCTRNSARIACSSRAASSRSCYGTRRTGLYSPPGTVSGSSRFISESI